MADLFVTDHTPTLGVGRALRSYAIIRALAARGPIDVLYVRFGAPAPTAEYTSRPNIRLHAVDSSRGLRRAATVAGSRLAGAPSWLARVASPELIARAAELAPAPGSGRVIADGIAVRVALRSLEARHELVLNAHNLESDLRAQLGGERSGAVKRLTQLEARMLARSSESWMVSRADMEGARALCPAARLRLVPNVVDTAAITPVVPPPRTDRALLVADFTWPPNREAARFLIDGVMPRVWQSRPEARLTLVGRGLTLPAEVDRRVEAAGFVESLDDQYARSACVVVPLLKGGGSPLKFVEGLAHGLPVVATPRAAQGLDVTPGVHFVKGEGVDGFARALVGVLADGAPDIAAAGRDIAERQYSIEALETVLA